MKFLRRTVAAILSIIFCVSLMVSQGSAQVAGNGGNPNGGFAGNGSPAQPNNVVTFPSPIPTTASVQRAADFTSSIRFNAHIETGGIYTSNGGANLNNMLAQTKTKHLRSSVSNGSNNTAYLKTLHANFGLMYDFLSDPTQTVSSIQTNVNAVGSSMVESIEGVNECDISNVSGCNGSSYPTVEATSQATVYTAAKSFLPSIKVIGPSNTSEAAYTAVGNLAPNLDYGNMHDYTGPHPPETSGFGGTDGCGTYGADAYAICIATQTSVGKSVVSTESGWCDTNYAGDNYNGGDNNSCIPAFVKADYVARTFLYHWYEGVPATYYFELADGSTSPGFSAHGIYTALGAPKPAAIEVANLQAILADSSANSQTFTPTNTYGASVTPPGGSYAIFLQRADGVQFVVYWEGCEEYNGATNTPSSCSPSTATETFSSTPPSITNWSLNLSDGGEATQTTVTPASSLTLTFLPQVQIQQIGSSLVPATLATAAPALPTPVAVTYAQTAEANNGGGASYNIVATATPSPNTLLFSGQLVGASGDTTSISGFTTKMALNNNGTGLYATSQYKIAPVSAVTTYTVTETGGGNAGGVLSNWAGIDTTTPIGDDQVNNTNTNQQVNCPAATANRAGSMAQCTIYVNGGTANGAIAQTPVAPIGWVYVGNTNAAYGEVFVFRTAFPTQNPAQTVGNVNVNMGSSGTNSYLTNEIAETTVFQPPFTSPTPAPIATPTPLQPSLALWLDASDSTTVATSSGSASQWLDKSINGNNVVNSVFASQPTVTTLNSLSALSFNGSQQLNTPSGVFGINGSLNYSIFVVVTDTNTSQYQQIFGGQINSPNIGATNGSHMTLTTNAQHNDTVVSTTAGIWEGIDSSGGTYAEYINGNAGSTGTSSAANVAMTQFNVGNSPGANNWTGIIAEVVVYASVLTTAQRQQIEGYLAWKWGYQASLPAGHPYKSVAPSGFLPTNI